MKGMELKALREGVGVNQTEIARELGVQRSTVWRWEKENGDVPKWAGMHVERWVGDEEWCRRVRGARKRERRVAELGSEGIGDPAAGVAIEEEFVAIEVTEAPQEEAPQEEAPKYAIGKGVDQSRARVRACKDKIARKSVAVRVGVSDDFLFEWSYSRAEMTVEEYGRLQEVEIEQAGGGQA